MCRVSDTEGSTSQVKLYFILTKITRSTVLGTKVFLGCGLSALTLGTAPSTLGQMGHPKPISEVYYWTHFPVEEAKVERGRERAEDHVCGRAGISSHSCSRSHPGASIWPKALSSPPAPPGGRELSSVGSWPSTQFHRSLGFAGWVGWVEGRLV